MIATVNRNPSAKDLRQFGVVMLIGLGVIGGLVWWRLGGSGVGRGLALALWIIGGLCFLVEFAAPASVGRPLYVGWMSVAAAIGKVMVPLFLSVLYFTFLAPFALIRLGDPLRKRLRPAGESYWEPHTNHEPTVHRMHRPF